MVYCSMVPHEFLRELVPPGNLQVHSTTCANDTIIDPFSKLFFLTALMSESAIQDLARLMHATKVFVKLHRKFLLNRIHKVGMIVVIYMMGIHYLIAKSTPKHVHCRSCR
jgi:hypothetical protein